MPRAIISGALPFAALLLAATPAAAQTGACGTIWPLQVSADDVAFGTYISSGSSPVSANGRVTVACGGDPFGVYLPSFTVALSAGNGGTGFNSRRMSNGTYRLNYNLYTNAPYTIVWGDGTAGTQTQSYNALNLQRSSSMTVYGRIPASQLAAAGTFVDTITVTITY
jgi:spore coat protein U-like protein